MKYGATARTPSLSDDTQSSKSAPAAVRLPQLRQHRAVVTLDDGVYVIEFEGGPTTEGRTKEEAMAMAEDALACLADRHPDNYNAKFSGDDSMVVWEMV